MLNLQKEKITEIYKNDKISFQQTLSQINIKIISYTPSSLEFDLINTPAPIANALRRILISEVPTVAVEKVTINRNTGVLADEILSHRLGLVPLHCDPDVLDFVVAESDATNTLKFVLKCVNTSGETMTVWSDMMVWVPMGDQEMRMGCAPKFERCVVTRLAPGQEIDCELFCEKNIGKEHAKWSPVCPASYRLMPVIEIGDVYDEEAVKLQKCFSEGVIGIKHADGRVKAFVNNPRLDTMSREVLRHSEFEGRVFLGRKTDHFIFTIESVYLDPLCLLKKAIYIFIKKCEILKEDIYDRPE